MRLVQAPNSQAILDSWDDPSLDWSDPAVRIAYRERFLYRPDRQDEDVLTLRRTEIVRIKRDPYYWLQRWVWTLDTHDREQPIKPFPDRPYIRRAVDVWRDENLLLVPKSRQIMASWTFVALYVHDTAYNVGRFNFFQSKKEEDADALLDRGEFILRLCPQWQLSAWEKTYCNLKFKEMESLIKAVPQGGHQLRMYTASGILIDEAAFQPELEDCWTALKPALDGGGRVTMVSSANPGFFERLVNDKMEMAE